MRPFELGLLYALIGVAVAWVQHSRHRPGVLWSFVLWPVFLPGLLSSEAPVTSEVSVGSTRALPPAPWGPAIEDAVAGLRIALEGWENLPGVHTAEAALAAADRGLCDLAWRLVQLDEVAGHLPAGEGQPGPLAQARARHRAQLSTLRGEAEARLVDGLAQLTELSTHITVARFTGAALDDVTAQLERLAGAVDAAGEVARVGR